MFTHFLHECYTIMASFSKTASGNWRCSVMLNYKRHTRTFRTKQEGNAWAVMLEQDAGLTVKNKTFGELLNEYCDKVSVNKKGERWERIRIAKFQHDKLANIKIADLNKSHFADWRDRRMKEVSNLSVLREWALLHHALHIAVNEWQWLQINPMSGLKKPIGEAPRDRLITDNEIVNLSYALNYSPDNDLKMVTSRVGAAFCFAIETALRAQELCYLKWADVSGRVIKIKASKTRAGIREVPLSARALAILEQCKGIDENYVFNIKTSQIDSLFRKAKAQCLITDLHFHDTRHLAITRLATKLNILELAKMVGHKDLRMLQIYFNPTTESLADKL